NNGCYDAGDNGDSDGRDNDDRLCLFAHLDALLILLSSFMQLFYTKRSINSIGLKNYLPCADELEKLCL
ncbi:MAG: hypothetical protein II425_05095, partial [Oscillospiraceae bacterium]|nr:hypothetical protein [Oscillospiraceae bacterium]